MRFKNLLLTLLVAFTAMPLAAQLQDGKIYRFVNKANTNIAMEAASTTDIYGTAMSDRYSQYWLAEKHPNNDAAWSLRSLGNGLYVVPRGTSTGWTFSASQSASTVLYCVNTNGNYYTFNSKNHADDSGCMHYATSQGGRVVGWNTGADATHWTIEEVSLDAAELEANWAELDKFNSSLKEENIVKYEAALANLFNDKACTQLKKNFASVDALKNDADYQVLPEALQEMAVKIYTGNWQEDNLDSSKPYWDSEHAKRFRIQSIEPYSVAGEATEFFGLNAHINMDNPLGITGNYRQHVFVIVEGEIKDGAELTLGTLQGHGLLATYDNGIALKEGLNVVPFHANGNTLYINYVVHTYQNGKFVNPLSGYKDLKVHVAGGNVNGYYNGVGDYLWGEPDDDDDWQYYEDRTNTESATLLGKRQILHFTMWPTVVNGEDGTYTENNCMSRWLPDNISVPVGTPTKQKVNTMLEAWDRIHLSELATMGLLSKAEMDSLNALYPRYNEKWEKSGNIYDYTDAMYAARDGVDYGDHFNHHGVALGNFSGYMSGGWRNCNYNQNTMNQVIGDIATNAGSAWGPAHEIGHQHQKVFSVNGLTEVTNNVHSNIAVWYMGLGTSRVNGWSGNLDNVYNNYKNNKHFLFHAAGDGSQNLWSQTQMYYRLWLYYHRAGHKTDFYPILFELNRRDRMSSNNLGWIDGKGHASGTESMLKYYKQACQAAGEDLTEFFRAYGFFVLMNQAERGDYSTSFYTQTQKEVDDAIAWVKAQGYKENLAPLFTNDCVATPSYGHDGKTQRSYWDGEATTSGENAKLGMYTDCIDKNVKAEGYLYTIYKTTVTIMHEGAKGAIGFIVYDENDNLVAFTNNYTVNLPATATKVKIYAVQADGTKVEVKSAAEGGTEEQQIEALTKAITAAESLLGKANNPKYASYLRASAVVELAEMVAEAQAALDNKDQSQYTYGAWAMNLTNATNELKTNPSAFVGIKALNHYELRCAQGNFGQYLAYYDNGVKAAAQSQVAKANDDRRWEFVPVEGEEGVYYIRNVGQNKFILEVGNGSNALLGTSLAAGSQKFTIFYNGDGTASILKAGEPNVSLYRDSDYSIVGKEPGEKSSQWRIELYTDNATAVEIAELEALVAEAERVIAEAGNGIDNLAVYVSDIELADFVRRVTEAKNAAEAALADLDNVEDLAPYIYALETAIADTEAVYVLKPQSSHGETIYYYYLKDVDAGTYAFVNPDATGKYIDAMGTAELDTENDNYVWAFVKNSNGELQIYNKGYDAYLYTLSSSPNPLKADKAEDAGNYVFSVDNDKKALVITEGAKYLYNQSGRARIYSSKSYWKLELIGTEEGSLTSIVEIETEATAPVLEGIFDLTGRKIEEITEPGIYIVNGKKVLVK